MAPIEINQGYEVIGSTEYIDVAGFSGIPAKIDTGADASAIWASHINMSEDGVLTFCLFGEESPLYTGKTLQAVDYTARTIRSSHGDEQVRYKVRLPIRIGGREFTTTFSLANRSRNTFPALIGRHTIEGKFLVDVSKSSVKHLRKPKPSKLHHELKTNPYEFHQKYIKKGANDENSYLI